MMLMPRVLTPKDHTTALANLDIMETERTAKVKFLGGLYTCINSYSV